MQKKNTREAGKKKTQAAVNESYLQTVFRRFRKHRLALVSFIVLVALVGAALLAPWIAPYDPNAIVGPFSGAPTLQNWLGTDQIGRDVLSRLLYAMRISLLVGALATLISTVIGVVLGLIAGYFGGIADMLWTVQQLNRRCPKWQKESAATQAAQRKAAKAVQARSRSRALQPR